MSGADLANEHLHEVGTRDGEERNARLTRDKDYLVRNGEVMIVDSFTGRVLAGRRYNEGMHQAIEAKENVEIKNENQNWLARRNVLSDVIDNRSEGRRLRRPRR